MDSKEQTLDLNFKILSKHYTNFNFGNHTIFLSTFDENESKNIILDKLKKLSLKNLHITIYINTEENLINNLALPIKNQMLHPQEEKFFKKTTVIVDLFNQIDKQKTISYLQGFSHHLLCHTELKLHLLLNKYDIRDYIAGSDLWENRTRTFSYEDNDVSKIVLKQKLEEFILPASDVIKKRKL